MADHVVKATVAQRQRLRELGAENDFENRTFANVMERDNVFRELENRLTVEERLRLKDLPAHNQRPAVCRIEEALTSRLVAAGFTQVVTPIMIARSSLQKMSIAGGHPLEKQIFWLDTNTCLRPMLAPNLYSLLRRFVRLWKKPIRIFEVGPCFRKDSRGKQHLDEFTMLNLVELGLPSGERVARIGELASLLMSAAGVGKYRLESQTSEVYSETVDVVAEDGTELCSAAMGPHPLDDAWGIVDTWVGLGFGIERLAMVAQGHRNIQRVGRSLIYADGLRLNV